MKRKPQKPSTATAESTPDYSLSGASIPGLEEVLQHLEDLRCPGTADLISIDDDPDDDETPISVSAWELRNTPADLLDGLIMLRLHSMLWAAGQTTFRPPRASLQLIIAATTGDRARIKSVLPGMIGYDKDLRDPALHVEADPSGRDRSMNDILNACRATLLRGDPVILVCSSIDRIPDDLRVVMRPPLKLPPLSRGMLQALMAFHFERTSVEITHPDSQVARLPDLAITAVFAAEEFETAMTRLDQAASPPTKQGVITLDDVYGQPEAVGALKQVVRDLRDYQSGNVKWEEVTKSFLLLGPPGTGKTLLAEGLSGSAGIEFVKTSYSDCQRFGHQGDMLRELNAAVERAIAAAPCVFFIDEIDSFHSRSTKSNNTYIIGVVNGLLTQIDRLSATAGIILIAATNDVERVDSAVIRPCRFDRHIHVGRPDRSGIRSMLRASLGSAVSTNDLAALADQLLGASGAEIAALTRDARTRARAAGTDLSITHIRAAADDIQSGFETDVLWRIAVHEAGHLLAGHLLGLPDAKSALVSARGSCVVRPRPKFRLQTTMHKLLGLDLAGRGAEEAVFQNHCDGSGNGPSSDLAQATRGAVEAECAHGFGSSLCWIDPSTPFVVLPPAIQKRVEARLVAATDHVRALFVQHRSDLERIARVLLERRELDAEEIAELMSSIPLAQGHAGNHAETDDAQRRETQPVDRDFLKETPDAWSL